MGWTALRVAGLLLWAGSAIAQGGLTANGQVYLPDGRWPSQEVRLHLVMESYRQPPRYIYTDMQGRFELTNLRALVTYHITVETDEKTWATTTVSFIPSGNNPRVDVFLQPLRKERREAKPPANVSVSALQQKIPAEARREFDIALKSIQQNDFAAARPHLERAIQIFPGYVDARNELAVALMKEGKLTDAEGHLRAALQADAAALRPLLNLGLCLSRQERFADAVPILEKAARLDPAEASAYLMLGVALFRSGKGDQAEPVLQKAYTLGGKKVSQAQFYLAQLYMERNDAARAAGALEIYLRDSPDDPNAEQLRATLSRLRSPTPDL